MRQFMLNERMIHYKQILERLGSKKRHDVSIDIRLKDNYPPHDKALIPGKVKNLACPIKAGISLRKKSLLLGTIGLQNPAVLIPKKHIKQFRSLQDYTREATFLQGI